MSEITIDVKGLTQLQQRIFEIGENPPPDIQLIHLVGQTDHNKRSVHERATYFPNVDISIPGHGNVSGYGGVNAWTKELVEYYGTPVGRILALPGNLVMMGDSKGFNTRSEMSELALWARQEGLQRIGIIAPRFHLQRAIMSAIAACAELNRALLVFPILGTDLPWDEVVYHSQGQASGTRADLMAQEAWRIPLYQAKGDLLSTERSLEYLERLQ